MINLYVKMIEELPRRARTPDSMINEYWCVLLPHLPYVKTVLYFDLSVCPTWSWSWPNLLFIFSLRHGCAAIKITFVLSAETSSLGLKNVLVCNLHVTFCVKCCWSMVMLSQTRVHHEIFANGVFALTTAMVRRDHGNRFMPREHC